MEAAIISALALVAVAVIEAIAARERRLTKAENAEYRAYRERVEAEQRANEAELAEKIAALCDGMRSMLRAELIRVHARCSEAGGATLVDKEYAEKVYGPYHALGGNGTGTDLYEEIFDMPTVRGK